MVADTYAQVAVIFHVFSKSFIHFCVNCFSKIFFSIFFKKISKYFYFKRDSMAGPPKQSIFKGETCIFHTLTLNGARGLTNRVFLVSFTSSNGHFDFVSAQHATDLSASFFTRKSADLGHYPALKNWLILHLCIH